MYTLEQKFIRSINYLKIINKIQQEQENKDCDKNIEKPETSKRKEKKRGKTVTASIYFCHGYSKPEQIIPNNCFMFTAML